jgi:hypothetical protein
MVRRTLAAGLTLGLLAGIVIAVVVPQTRPPASVASGVPADDVAPSSPTVRRVAAPRLKPKGPGYVRLRATGPITIEARARDPRGGPEWAVRSFMGERLAQTSPDGKAAAHVIGRDRCFQLGRLHAGRFGWLTSDGTFRPALIDLNGVPTRCVSRRPDLGDGSYAELRRTITDPDRPAARILGAVAWGAVGAAGQPTLRVHDQRATLAVGPHGGVLAILPGGIRRADVIVATTTPGQTPRRLLPADRPAGLFAGGTRILAAEAPDPDGGLPYALIVTKGPNGTCTMAGPRVIDGRAGSVDYALDTFTEDLSGGGGCTGPHPPRGRLPDGRTPPPWTLGTTNGGGVVREPGADPASGRIARRTPAGRVIVAGTADPDVASLTIASPADVRTIVPTGPTHGFIVVYGGAFATGDFNITTTYKNGTTRHDTVPAGL